MSNIRPYVIINGVDSRTIQGLLITSLPPISKPAQRTLTETIDGRDGDSSVKLGYSAYDKSLGIALTFGYNVDDVISFFNSEGTIVFSNEPDKLYNFEIFEAIDFEKLIRFKTATVTIHTQPFKFSTTENPLEFTEKEFTVVNNGNTDSRPNLVITGEGLATMQINGKNALNIDFGDAEQTLLIDSEGMNAYYTNNIKSIEAEIVATGGNGTPDNPNPINGYTEANITRCGVNLWDEEWESGSINASGIDTPDATRIRTKNYITVKPNTTYYFKSSKQLGLRFYDETKTGIGYDATQNSTFTIPSGCYYLRFTVVDTTTYNNDISINYPSSDSDTEYHPYTGNTYTIAFGQTVYGGVLDVTRGKLHVTHGYFMFDGSSMAGWSLSGDYGSSTRFDYSNSLIKPNTVVKSNLLPSGSVGNDREIITTHGSANRIILEIATSRLGTADVSGFVAYLENNNLQVVYELNEPFDIDLDEQVISALLGINNFYADTGNVTVIFVNDGQDETQTGAIVSFDLDESDLNKGELANRLVSGNYANIRLKTGSNAIKFIGSVSAVGLDKYSRWL